MKRLGLGFGVLLQAALITSASAHHHPQHPWPQPDPNSVQGSSGEQAPDCLDQDGNELQVNNDQVAQWKTSTPLNWLSRAHVAGTVVAVYANQTGHAHFGIELSGENTDLEVIYDLRFGSIPQVHVGDSIEACGDYITAYAQSGHYPPSPDGAIIHWIHKSDSSRHEDGFLMINGNVYGQDLPNHHWNY